MAEEHKKEKLAELIRHMSAIFLQKESNKNSLITVTRVVMSENLKLATILITSLPETSDNAALDFARRKRSEIREFIRKNSKIGHVPYLNIELDSGERNRQRIDELSDNQ